MPYLHMRINELLAERGMSKNVVCKLCTFLKCSVGDLIVYVDEDTHELKSPEI